MALSRSIILIARRTCIFAIVLLAGCVSRVTDLGAVADPDCQEIFSRPICTQTNLFVLYKGDTGETYVLEAGRQAVQYHSIEEFKGVPIPCPGLSRESEIRNILPSGSELFVTKVLKVENIEAGPYYLVYATGNSEAINGTNVLIRHILKSDPRIPKYRFNLIPDGRLTRYTDKAPQSNNN